MLVQNGLDLMQVGAYAANMVVGVILLLAMAISSSARR
jgi:ribose/xylose/arabinose/galactoside ABC-type transport system permease subunit